jgi:acyl-CoA thioesterase-1
MKPSALSVLTVVVILLLSAAALAQTPTPCQPDAATEKKMAAMSKTLEDWPNLARYREANANLAPPAPNEKRVVFMGDSITDGWNQVDAAWLPGLKPWFPGKPYIDRGISGQTTPQMLVRFRPDVIDLKPKVVVILAGINDIAGNTGPISLESTEENLASMADLARANGIRVVLSSLLPASNLPWRPSVTDVVEKVATLNAWIKDYAKKNHLVYLDYFSAMNDGHGGLKPELAHDAVHPNAAGYDVMDPLAEAAIQKALKERLR